MKFKVANINCQNCANLIKNSLEDEFGKIEVDLNVMPRTVEINITQEKLEDFKKEMSDLGFEVLEEL
ncbi:copper chaperone [Campylobacter novaezeelandiae]|uniref:Copper chaperone n=1 Tax=Campylobacter novaezeelandiae TaxID=2267891 RepID=A0A4Q9JU31_9BACT|nr:heavy-metal-associated domain-containing protein [Campylobacter novaezeelandiae]QWU80330.1 heavy-metal-associated domain-containing protein, putative copper metallochaperone CopZ [Campylobacter novaezeelandiae]TBR80074.1 copper chaperone [Campylobacter novaezeelandiae]TBR81120.1 copper chaperone [Campylobacter novaezeelandiae]TBR82643.1 copper chaperone [Campylobacter novaezeelandiae]